MAHWGIERRRVPRMEIAKEHAVSVDASIPVRVLDFSRSGVLLASRLNLGEDDCAEVVTVTSAGPLRVAVEIRHVTRRVIPRVGPRLCAGARFLGPWSAERERFDALLRAECT
jgi:hypothetical protein